MNCNEFQNMALLRQSGELSGEDIRILASHTASCRACSAFEKSLARISTDSKRFLLDRSPSRKLVSEVISKAETENRSGLLHLVRHPAAQWIALAASLTIVAGAYLMMTPPQDPVGIKTGTTSAPSNGSEVYALAEIATYNEDAANDIEASSPVNDTRSLADKLLELEGFSNGNSENELFTLFGVHDSTDPLSHNTPVSPSKTRV